MEFEWKIIYKSPKYYASRVFSIKFIFVQMIVRVWQTLKMHGSHKMMLQYIKIKKRFHEVCSTKGEPTLAEIKSACYDTIQTGFRRHSSLSDRIDDPNTPLETVLRIIFFEISKWISYDFLQCVVDLLGSPLKEIKDALREYSRQLCPVLKAKLKDVKLLRSQHENECQTPGGLIRVAARYHLNSDGIPVSMLIEARNFLANKLKIPKKLLVPITYEEGSITMIFWTLAELEESILEEVRRCEKDLKDAGIDCITIGRSATLLLQRTVWVSLAPSMRFIGKCQFLLFLEVSLTMVHSIWLI